MEPAYIAIAKSKQSQLQSKFPKEWILPPSTIPQGMFSPAESITNAKAYQRVNVMDVPRTCGLLSSRELEVTEAWDVKCLLGRIARGEVSSEVVARAFCKVSITYSL